MIESMEKNTKHPLVCMPWPARVEAIDASVAAVASLEPTTFRYLGTDDSRVRQYAERELDDYTLGLIEIDISGDEAEALPSVSMDESYRLSLAASVISLSSNTVWGAMRGLATLAQLARHGQLFAGLTIQDSPRFPWRGPAKESEDCPEWLTPQTVARVAPTERASPIHASPPKPCYSRER